MVTGANSDLSGFVISILRQQAEENRTLELEIRDFNNIAPQRT
jgi:hypothetical protein